MMFVGADSPINRRAPYHPRAKTRKNLGKLLHAALVFYTSNSKPALICGLFSLPKPLLTPRKYVKMNQELIFIAIKLLKGAKWLKN